MRKLIYWFLGAVTFIFVATSTIWKQAISLSLCGILGFNSVTCHGWFLDGWVNAAVPKSGVEIAQVDIFDNRNDGNSKPSNGNVDIFKKPNPNSDSSQPNRNNGKNQSFPDNVIDDTAKNTAQDVEGRKVYSFFINGIQNSESNYGETKLLVENLLKAAGVYPPVISTDTYNFSSVENGRKLSELSDKLEKINQERSSRLKNPIVQIITIDLILSSWGSQAISLFGDLIESTLQFFLSKVQSGDGKALVSKTTNFIKEVDKKESEKAKKTCKDTPKMKFVIVAHSQGNFFADEVAANLPNDIAKRTVILGFSTWHSYGKSQSKGIKVKAISRSEDISVIPFRILKKLDGQITISNLPPLPKYKDSQGELKESNIIENHSLKDYLGSPTKPEYTKAANESFLFASNTLGNLLNFDSGNYEKKKDCSEQALKTGKSYGDPHIITFDGYRYSFQMVGEFTLVKAKDNSFEIQVRQGAVPGRQLSLNTGAAMKVGNTRVAFYSKDFPDANKNTQLRVDGKPTVVEGSLSLPGGGVITRSGGDYVVIWPTGEQVTIHNITVAGSTFMNVIPAVPDQSDRYIGLLGNLNSDPNDDLRTRNGNIVPTKNNSTYGQLSTALNNLLPVPVALSKVETLFFDQLYKEFGDSWRINESESLFDYASGQSTDTFTKRGFPNNYISLSSFLPPQLRKAEEICQRAGVSGDLLDGCIFDVANTGEAGFAQAAADAVTGIVKDRVQQEIRNRIPVNIPGVRFP
ncbi:VWD domain-containing protein [Anabaena catenula]|uniref:VWD domain-containing protein n=1 Tax=Anabaena catenula FACHB-362 TaxID=2692877 RepID=A0ABR8IZ53_9NOST|nr:VWD domain-containing protein [Anabaena catenula]MBD2691374.1 VWD domain-containing protein [Anabaena catenula FACHB-362]